MFFINPIHTLLFALGEDQYNSPFEKRRNKLTITYILPSKTSKSVGAIRQCCITCDITPQLTAITIFFFQMKLIWNGFFQGIRSEKFIFTKFAKCS